MEGNVIAKSFTASPGTITPATTPTTQIVGYNADVAGTLVIVDGLGQTRLDLKMIAGSLIFPAMGILCQNGAVATFTGATKLTIFFGA